MARFARLVVPNYPHYITQHGVHSVDIFADDQDRLTYMQVMAGEAELSDNTFLVWCVMSNHVHLMAVPGKGSLSPFPPRHHLKKGMVVSNICISDLR
jgi:REP element-mobilizing transposase RayT